MSSPLDTTRSRGCGRGGRGGREGRSPGRGSQKTTPTTGKFKGNCAELSGYVFDCSDYRQADKYVTNIKRIAEYMGAEYTHGGDIRSSLENEVVLTIPLPTEPTTTGAVTTISTSHSLIFKGQIDQYIRREAILQENMQKAYSLIIGQCTELLRANLKQSSEWTQVSSAFDVLGLTKLIKSIVFKFDNPKFLPVSLHQAKQNFYSLCQGIMTNAEYLEKFNNHMDIASSYDDEILDAAVLEYTRNKMHPDTDPTEQDVAQMAIVHLAAK
jgi:hypothetical protein